MKFLLGLLTTFIGVGTIETSDLMLGLSISLVGIMLMFGGVKHINEDFNMNDGV